MGWRDWFNSMRWHRAANQRYWEIAATDPLLVLYPGAARFQVTPIGSSAPIERRRCLLTVNAPGIAVYSFQRNIPVEFTCLPEELRWFGRPVKYHSGTNAILIHAEIAGHWYTLQLWLSRSYMYQLIRALKAIATPEQITAYRRRRPYIHYGPALVEPANQEITGEWVLEPPVTVFLNPAFFVILDGAHVLRTIPLQHVQRIQALHRLDAPLENGLVRFQVEGETLAFSLADHVGLADALAEAAKRTLEMPVLQKRKIKEEDDDAWEEANF